MKVVAQSGAERFTGGRIDVTDKDEVDRVRRQRRRRATWGRIALYTIAIIAALMAAGPFIWSAITSFKVDPDLYTKANNPFIYNLPPTLEHWRFLLNDTQFLTFAWNTLWVGFFVVSITLFVGLPAAYALARLDMKWSGPLGIAIFFVYLIPPTLLFIPMTRVVGNFSLLNNTWSLVLIYPTITIPVSVWLLTGFLKGIPKDVEEQALVDGYSRLSAFVRVVIPLAFPGIVRHRLRIHPDGPRVHLRARLYLLDPREDHQHRGPDGVDPRRCLLLAVTTGRRRVRRPADRARFQPSPRALHRGVHDGRGEGLSRDRDRAKGGDYLRPALGRLPWFALFLRRLRRFRPFLAM